MTSKDLKHISKKMSHALRHKPELYGLKLDRQGWCGIDELIASFNKRGAALNRETLEIVVEQNDKHRFAISEDGRRIRANQGHSINIDLGYEPVAPPEYLFHGTAEKNIASIREKGLHRGKRHHVHLSPDRETARQVGGRHGRPQVLRIRAKAMQEAGYSFYRSENGVWLTAAVPAAFIEF